MCMKIVLETYLGVVKTKNKIRLEENASKVIGLKEAAFIHHCHHYYHHHRYYQ